MVYIEIGSQAKQISQKNFKNYNISLHYDIQFNLMNLYIENHTDNWKKNQIIFYFGEKGSAVSWVGQCVRYIQESS